MDWSILHAFADEGVESEALSVYGHVTRVGLNPRNTPYTDRLIASDVRDVAFDQEFDLGLFHPPCQSWTPGAQSQGTAQDHDNLIPTAREIARDTCDEWIIENVPQAPLHNPIVLNGGMFGVPLHYERAFETSYHVPQPPRNKRLGDIPGPFSEHHKTGGWQGPVELWKNAKGYSGDYRARSLKREAVPRPYLNYLIRPLL